MTEIFSPGRRLHTVEHPIDAEAHALVAQIACDCVKATCPCLTSHAAALIRRVDMLGEPLDAAAAALGFDARAALVLLEEARWAAAQALVRTLAPEAGPASGQSKCLC